MKERHSGTMPLSDWLPSKKFLTAEAQGVLSEGAQQLLLGRKMKHRLIDTVLLAAVPLLLPAVGGLVMSMPRMLSQSAEARKMMRDGVKELQERLLQKLKNDVYLHIELHASGDEAERNTKERAARVFLRAFDAAVEAVIAADAAVDDEDVGASSNGAAPDAAASDDEDEESEEEAASSEEGEVSNDEVDVANLPHVWSRHGYRFHCRYEVRGSGAAASVNFHPRNLSTAKAMSGFIQAKVLEGFLTILSCRHCLTFCLDLRPMLTEASDLIET